MSALGRSSFAATFRCDITGPDDPLPLYTGPFGSRGRRRCNPALWELKIGKSDPEQACVPLVKLIRYSQDDPSTLKLVSNAAAPIRKEPGGATIARRWTHLCEGCEPLPAKV